MQLPKPKKDIKQEEMAKRVAGKSKPASMDTKSRFMLDRMRSK